MDYKGKPCKKCGGVILVYSSSGFCRRCWHTGRGGKTFPGSKAQKSAEDAKAMHKQCTSISNQVAQ